MDNGTKKYLDLRFESLEKLVQQCQDRFESVLRGETPCKPAVDIASLRGKVKMLRLLWIPLTLAAVLIAVRLMLAKAV